MRLSQTKQIETYLKKGKALTPIVALKLFGCLRLAARVNDLRAQGLKIDSRIVEKGGKRFAEYKVAA